MEKRVFELNIAGRTVRYLLRQSGSERLFPWMLRHCDGEAYDVELTDEDLERGSVYYSPGTSKAWLEYKLLLWPTADYLLRSSACIVHSVSLTFCGKAWLLCAPSGTGKTTQFVRWRQLIGGAVRLISGDMSAVTLEHDGRLLVWATPWTGKERWVGDPGPAELGGIIFLEQAECNDCQRLQPGDAAMRLVDSICSQPETEGDVHAYAQLANAMASRPAWLLRNRGDSASAQMAMDAIKAERSKDK